MPITVAIYSGTGSSAPIKSATFIPPKDAELNSVSFVFDAPLPGETTYYIAMYDPSTAYNKSAAIIQAESVVIPGDTATAEANIYVKVNGTYVDVGAAVLALINDHVADTDNPHGVTYTQAGAAAASHTHSAYVPTSRTVNGHALSSNVTVTLSDVGGAAASHAHGNITSDGKIGSAADQILVTGTGGGVTLASPGVLKLLLAIAMSDVGTTAGITDIKVGTGDPGTLATGVVYLKREA